MLEAFVGFIHADKVNLWSVDENTLSSDIFIQAVRSHGKYAEYHVGHDCSYVTVPFVTQFFPDMLSVASHLIRHFDISAICYARVIIILASCAFVVPTEEVTLTPYHLHASTVAVVGTFVVLASDVHKSIAEENKYVMFVFIPSAGVHDDLNTFIAAEAQTPVAAVQTINATFDIVIAEPVSL